jgi:hypothetical protein
MRFGDTRMRRSALFLGGLSLFVFHTGCSQPDRAGLSDSRKTDAAPRKQSPRDENQKTETEKTAVTADKSPSSDKKELPPPDDKPVTPKTTDLPKADTPKRKPIRPTDNWVIFREAFQPNEDAICGTAWTGTNQFEVKTENVQRVTIDLTRLPEGAPTKGPWIIRLDGQAVELTGFKPREGYTGLKRDLVRSQNGKWSVDKTKLYRTGST